MWRQDGMNNIIKYGPIESGVHSPTLVYNSYQSVSIFCADSSISPDCLWVPSVWNCNGLTPRSIWGKAAFQAWDLLGRRVRKECRFAKKSSFHSVLTLKKKPKLFPPSMLPQSVQVLKFKCPALGAINKAHFWVLPGHLLQLSPHQAHLVIASLHHSLSCLKWTCQSWKWSFLPCVKADTGMDGQSYIVGSTAILSGAA